MPKPKSSSKSPLKSSPKTGPKAASQTARHDSEQHPYRKRSRAPEPARSVNTGTPSGGEVDQADDLDAPGAPPTGAETLPRAGQSPGKPDSTEARRSRVSKPKLKPRR